MMKITRIEPVHVSIPFEHGAPQPSEGLGAGGRFDILFVRVETDAGITGWGEAFGYAAGPVTMAALTRIVAPGAVGGDATDIPALMGELWFRTRDQSYLIIRGGLFGPWQVGEGSVVHAFPAASHLTTVPAATQR